MQKKRPYNGAISRFTVQELEELKAFDAVIEGKTPAKIDWNDRQQVNAYKKERRIAAGAYKGGTYERTGLDLNDPDQRREYMRRWRQKNPDKVRRKNKRFYKKKQEDSADGEHLESKAGSTAETETI